MTNKKIEPFSEEIDRIVKEAQKQPARTLLDALVALDGIDRQYQLSEDDKKRILDAYTSEPNEINQELKSGLSRK